MTLARFKSEKFKNFDTNVIGYLNINYSTNTFTIAQYTLRDFGTFLISESKLNNTLSSNNFKADIYKMFRLDRKRYGVGPN